MTFFYVYNIIGNDHVCINCFYSFTENAWIPK